MDSAINRRYSRVKSVLVRAVIQRFFPVLITDDEITSIIELAKAIQPERWEYNWQPEHFVPLGWAADVVHHARRRGLISSDVQAEACVNVRCALSSLLFAVLVHCTYLELYRS